jgi:hypothetical protein
MLYGPTCDDQLGRVHERIRHARTVTPELVSDFVGAAGIGPARGGKGRLAWLIEADARTEAALALIDAAVPQWKLRSITYDDGEWHCSLSRQRGVPAEFDDTADGHHENLALAIMAAIIEARHIGSPMPRAPAVPLVRGRLRQPVCCDNFS